jgi:hypothetical protein
MCHASSEELWLSHIPYSLFDRRPALRLACCQQPATYLPWERFQIVLVWLFAFVAAHMHLGLGFGRFVVQVVKSAKLELIRLTILNNLLAFHPESGEQLAWGTPSARAGGAAASQPVLSSSGRILECGCRVPHNAARSLSATYCLCPP